jgi:hypothetical protein
MGPGYYVTRLGYQVVPVIRFPDIGYQVTKIEKIPISGDPTRIIRRISCKYPMSGNLKYQISGPVENPDATSRANIQVVIMICWVYSTIHQTRVTRPRVYTVTIRKNIYGESVGIPDVPVNDTARTVTRTRPLVQVNG